MEMIIAIWIELIYSEGVANITHNICGDYPFFCEAYCNCDNHIEYSAYKINNIIIDESEATERKKILLFCFDYMFLLHTLIYTEQKHFSALHNRYILSNNDTRIKHKKRFFYFGDKQLSTNETENRLESTW